jgi:hypothetical protein
MSELLSAQQRNVQLIERMARAWYFKRDSSEPNLIALRNSVQTRGESLLTKTIELRLGRIVLSVGAKALDVVSFMPVKDRGYYELKYGQVPADEALDLITIHEDTDGKGELYFGNPEHNLYVTFGLLAQGLGRGRKLILAGPKDAPSDPLKNE